MNFVRGQKSKMSDVTAAMQVEVAVEIAAPAGQSIDISCFGLDANGKLSDENYFIFYNQKSSPCGSLSACGPQYGGKESFRVDLNGLPSTIKRLVFTATLDGSGTMSALGPCWLKLVSDGEVKATYSFSGADLGNEKALMIAELYHKDVWRFAVSGQGFDGGLSALLAYFGGQEAASPAAPPPAPAPPAPPAPAPAPPPPPKVNIGKVNLAKRGASQAVNLKKGGGSQPIHINLNWDQQQPKKGFLSSILSAGGSVDLDLGCMFLMTDGQKGVIQPLGERFGSRTSPPYIHLDKDDRSGAASDGENMYLFRPDLIERVVVFAMIYEGTANFATVNGRLTIRDEHGGEIFVPLNTPDSSKHFCAVVSIRRDSGSILITKEERYFKGHKDCDEAFGFGFRWVAGEK